MSALNYQHLLYFWTAARRGGVTRASEELHLTQPTLSAQIRQLERRLGHALFRKQGRGLVLTEEGELAARYAEEIFALGRELLATLEGREAGRPPRLRVGVVDAVPKLVAYRLLAPARTLPVPARLVCVEGKLDQLLGELALHRLDAVVSDAPLPSGSAVRAFSHLLGESAVAFFAVPALAKAHRRGFPKSLEGAPVLLPTEGTSLRTALASWLERSDIAPRVVGEFEDGALLSAFGQAGLGLFPATVALAREEKRQFGVVEVGRVPGVSERYFVLSAERRLRNPGVVAISEGARGTLRASLD
jgi:LysR family transcriptional activator of nhaA